MKTIDFILILFSFLDVTDKIKCNDKPRCIVPGCKYPCLTTKFTHPLPTSKEILKKWLQKLDRPKFEPTSTSVICYKHFQDHDYVFSYVATRGISIQGEVRNVAISRATQQLLCSRSHDFLAIFALAHSKINQIA